MIDENAKENGVRPSFDEFEARVSGTAQLELSWTYWNALLPDTTGRALWMLFIEPAFRQMTTMEKDRGGRPER